MSLEEALSRLNTHLYGAMMDILLAAVIAESDWGRNNPLTVAVHPNIPSDPDYTFISQ